MNSHTRRDFLRGALGLTAAALWRGRGARAASRKKKTKLNFVFLLIDDMGWADVGCYGPGAPGYHETPTIDKLARQGMRFTDAYAACPVCSPTRASILTGKYPARLGVTDFIPGHWRPWEKLVVPKIHNQLPLDETTIPEALKAAGYVSGCFGKWHLGWGRKFGPQSNGFDVAPPGGRNQKDKRVTSLTDQALKFIEDNKDKPFFLYLSHHTVHIPLEAPADLVAKYKAKLKPGRGQKPPPQANPIYAAMVEHLDRSIARVLDKLDRLGLAERTVVIFYSDNGGLIKIYTGDGPVVTSNLPLRSEKGTLYEGGVRVPLIVRWPGRVKPNAVCATPVTSVDFYPTILEIAGAPGGAKADVDGASLVGLLQGGRPPRRDAIYWHYPHYHHCRPCGAVRAGRYKLIEYYEDGRLELYDLAADVGEKTNLAEKLPKRAAELRAKLAAWRKSVAAGMPTPNPNHDPAKAHEWRRRIPRKKTAPKKKRE